ncbi:MAG: hypothetical protein JWR10_2777 [Rubritepida sp.]|nr:hypothetical protein [Rubritepida sp.]
MFAPDGIRVNGVAPSSIEFAGVSCSPLAARRHAKGE